MVHNKKIILFLFLNLQGHFLINRHDVRDAIKTLDHVRLEILKGKSLLIFPEGTRSDHGEISEFKRGAFNLAVETGTQIVPVCVDGTTLINPKHTLFLRPGKVRCIIGDPIPVEQVQGNRNIRESALNLSQKIRKEVTSLQDKIKLK